MEMKQIHRAVKTVFFLHVRSFSRRKKKIVATFQNADAINLWMTQLPRQTCLHMAKGSTYLHYSSVKDCSNMAFKWNGI